MDNLDDSETNAKISDSGYSNSCSNSQSRRSRSSKSTHSGSHSSGSSGYGERKPSASGYSLKSSGLAQQLEKRPKKANSDPLVIDAGGDTKACTTIFEAPEEVLIQDCPTSDKECVKTLPVVEIMDICNSERNNTTNEGQICAPVQKTVTSYSSVGFSCVISMHDGIVMYTTSTITTSLGFPREMWIGRSFIDFVHPKDRDTFAAQITNGLAEPKITIDTIRKAPLDNFYISSMVSRIRRYRGITTGYGVKEVIVSYMPFSLKLSFKRVDDDEGNVMYLVIQATPFFSAFNMPNEPFTKATPFIIRHSANGNLEYLDPNSVPYLGYLPQDMLNKNVLHLYHHEDLPYLKQVYKKIVKEGGMPRCQSYRIQAQNGDYVRVETEWFSFINPWSRKLEFVIGKHFIVEGPTNIDVFETSEPDKINFLCDEEEKEVQAERDHLVKIMHEVLTKPAEIAKQLMTKRCQDLATFMERLMDDSSKTNDELKLEIQGADQSYERDSVMLGGISPHHENSDSKSSTGTPLSYNQLNYNENLQRYFESHRSNDVDVPKPQVESTATKNEIIPGPSNWIIKTAQESAETNSVDNVSSSNDFSCMRVCSQKIQNTQFKPLRLTESVMSKHNTEMEKELYKKHREQRSNIKGDRLKANDTYQKKKEHLARCNASYQPTSAVLPPTPEPLTYHGLKRTQKMNVNDNIAPKKLCASLNQSSRPSISVSHIPPPAMNSMQGVMYGQAVYGQPFMYSPMSHPMQNVQPIALSSTSQFDSMNTFGLGNSNYEEACKISLPARSTTSSRNFWSPKKRQDFKIAASISGQGQGSTNSSNNTGRLSIGAVSFTRNFNDKTDGESSYSSFYSSFFKTESGSADDSDTKKNSTNDKKAKLDSTHGYFESHAGKKVHKRKMDPPWLEQVCITPYLMYKYQIKNKSKEEILASDKLKIQKLAQPSLVNEQLGQLYLDLHLEGVASRLTLEEGITSSSSSGEETPTKTPKRVRSKREHSKLVMIYEEDAPLPSPPEFKEPSPGPSKS